MLRNRRAGGRWPRAGAGARTASAPLARISSKPPSDAGGGGGGGGGGAAFSSSSARTTSERRAARAQPSLHSVQTEKTIQTTASHRVELRET
jgi:hypothetical protein